MCCRHGCLGCFLPWLVALGKRSWSLTRAWFCPAALPRAQHWAYGAGSFGVAVSAPLFCWPLQQSLFFGEGSPGVSLGMKLSPGLAEAPLLLPGEASLGKGRHLDRVTVWERAWEVLAVTYLGTTSLLSQILSSIWACSSLGSWGSCSLWQDGCEP